MSQDWDRFGSWHGLFDGLCQIRGYSENSELASELCRHMGRSGERDFQAAEKNLRDWRRGRRIPLRRNVVVLSQLLAVDSDPRLKGRWEETYRALQVREDVGKDPDEQQPTSIDIIALRNEALLKRMRLFLIAALPAGLVVAAAINRWDYPDGEVVDRKTLPTVAYNARAFLSVGTEKLIHGAVEEFCGAPSAWADLAPTLPQSRTGRLVDGGLATQMMNGCGKEMVVRAVKFIADKPGVEELVILNSYFKIEVAPALTVAP